MSRERIFKRWRLASIAALAPLTLASVLAVSASAQSVVAQQMSQNWSGYVVTSNSGQSYSSVSGSWVQPRIDPSSTGDASSAFWIGLGGSSDSSSALEQVGTGADVSGGQTTYYAWYELVPAAQQRLSLQVNPGDHMSARVGVQGSSVTVSISDQTTGQAATKTLHMDSPDTSSAEWIAEAPALETGAGAQILPLADFGSVTFTNTSATAGGHTGSIADSDWSAEQIDLSADGQGQTGPGDGRFAPGGSANSAQASGGGASAGSASGDGSSFTVTYSADTGSGQSASGSGYADPGYGSTDPGYGYTDPGYGYPGNDGYGDSGGYTYGG
jgi:Peptidase A4 family